MFISFWWWFGGCGGNFMIAISLPLKGQGQVGSSRVDLCGFSASLSLLDMDTMSVMVGV